jgi:hypothetical protein
MRTTKKGYVQTTKTNHMQKKEVKTFFSMLAIEHFDPKHAYKTVFRRHKHKRRMVYELRNKRVEGCIFGGRVTRHFVDIDHLGWGEILERRHRQSSIFDKYRLFFPSDEVFRRFVRVSYRLGEPFWMWVLGWIRGQKHSGHLEKVFWELKTNTYLR